MRLLLKIILIVVVLVLIAVISLPFLISADRFRPMVEAKLTDALARKVTLGNLKMALLSGGVSAGDVAIAEDPRFGREPFVKARSLSLSVELWPLITSRKLNVKGLTIEQPQVALIQTPSGEWNFSSLGAKAAPAAPPTEPSSSTGKLDLSVKSVELKDGRFSLATNGRAGKPLALEAVNLQVLDFSPSSEFPFKFSARVAGGGEIKLDGKAGPIDPVAAEITPLNASIEVTRLDLVGSGLASISPGLAGILSLKGTGASRNGDVSVNARLTAEKLKVAPNGTPAKRPVEVGVALNHSLKTHSGALRQGDVKIGGAVARITGAYSQRAGKTFLNMKLAGSNMPIPDLAELLPPLGITLPSGSSLQGGSASANLTMEGPADELVSKGAVALNKTRLANFDLGSKVAAVASVVGINAGPNTDIETFSADLNKTPAGLTAQNIRFLAPAIGELSGGGMVNPANALDFKMRVQLHTTGRAAILGQTAVPFIVVGPASNPVFRPDTKALAAEGAQKVKEVARERATKAAGSLLDRFLGGKKQEPQK